MGLEQTFTVRGEFYYERVDVNNLRIDQVPDVFIARMFDFEAHKLLELTNEETIGVNLGQLFS